MFETVRPATGPSKEAASLSKTTFVTRGALSHLTVENGRLHSVESRGQPVWNQ